ncbi:MAG TPA: carboxymuconolactone decarboxylase family protein [Thermoleophilaceae bacterium]|nr:carboxymuconolactone decarboxylase family protein [Thermoleophilaceae bacterium]
MASAPRIPPGTRSDVGTLNFLIASALGRVAGTGPLNIMTTLGRHRRLFRRWLRFAGGLMPGGTLPRTDSELVILRCAHNCSSPYEWEHHQRIGALEGLSQADIERVKAGPDADGWSERQAALLRATDELHANRTISDGAWDGLARHLGEKELIELCLLVGHYEMIAMTLNSLGTPLDRVPERPGRVAQAVTRLRKRRR